MPPPQLVRAEEVLSESEMGRAEDFARMIGELASVMPLPRLSIDWVVARAIAASIWRYDRETGDAEALAAQAGIQLLAVRRADQFRDADARTRLRGMYCADIRAGLDLHRELRAALAPAIEMRRRA
jgi:hypothetical protein